jgi:hypothetical protein
MRSASTHWFCAIGDLVFVLVLQISTQTARPRDMN